MKRIFPAYAYGPGPRSSCWWDDTAAASDWPVFQGGCAEVAIIGAGFTGLSAAYHMAKSGVSVSVLDAEIPGWGASGRNGGFCCLGGAKLGTAALAKRYGADADVYSAAEHAAVDLVAQLLRDLDIDADCHSDGETELAHTPRAMTALRTEAALLRAAGLDHDLIEAEDLPGQGLGTGFHGALTRRAGFALNPRKYVLGLAQTAAHAGARIFGHSPALSITRQPTGHAITTPHGVLQAKQVIIATNGYSSEDLPDWLGGRYMPAQSTILVTRPLTQDELAAQSWHSPQMAFDTRHLLHYFRLMPDRRFLFGMRGGLLSSPRAERQARARTRKDFERMFPAWRHVPDTHSWSGLVCLSRDLVPFVGAVPGHPGLFAGLAYHGNGVAMGSYAGRLLADQILSQSSDLPYPKLMQTPPRRFPLGRARRLVMPPADALMRLADL